MNPAFQAGKAGMAKVAVFYCPGYFPVMAHATEFSINNLTHGNIITPCTHFEAQFVVADFATESNSVKPV